MNPNQIPATAPSALPPPTSPGLPDASQSRPSPATVPSASPSSPSAPKLPPALRNAKSSQQPNTPPENKPKSSLLAPKVTPSPTGSKLSSETARVPAASPAVGSAPSPTTAPTVQPPLSTVRPPTGGTIRPTPPLSSVVPTKKDAPPKPTASPASPAVTPAKLFVPPPRDATKRIPTLDRLALIEGSFLPEGGEPFTVEAPLTGDPLADRQTLVNLARKISPAGRMKLASQRIFTRDRETPPGYAAGTNLGQLFGEAGSDTEAGVEIGHVFFEGSRCQIFLRNLRSRSAVTIALRPATGGPIVFSNQIAPNRPVADLDLIVKEILGQGARELTITLREAK